MIPFASGLYAVVVFVAMPSLDASCVHNAEVNTEPLSDVMESGRPNLETHACNKAVTHDVVDASFMGTASGHLVDLSIAVNR